MSKNSTGNFPLYPALHLEYNLIRSLRTQAWVAEAERLSQYYPFTRSTVLSLMSASRNKTLMLLTDSPHSPPVNIYQTNTLVRLSRLIELLQNSGQISLLLSVVLRPGQSRVPANLTPSVEHSVLVLDMREKSFLHTIPAIYCDSMIYATLLSSTSRKRNATAQALSSLDQFVKYTLRRPLKILSSSPNYTYNMQHNSHLTSKPAWDKLLALGSPLPWIEPSSFQS